MRRLVLADAEDAAEGLLLHGIVPPGVHTDYFGGLQKGFNILSFGWLGAGGRLGVGGEQAYHGEIEADSTALKGGDEDVGGVALGEIFDDVLALLGVHPAVILHQKSDKFLSKRFSRVVGWD